MNLKPALSRAPSGPTQRVAEGWPAGARVGGRNENNAWSEARSDTNAVVST
eukprot:CAMPEP_0170400378 /NCGR_PEP_ID=MMETSP0117_2-20130122/24470_1 /TAXON_ID=400756 /ORGANISM="Durinskia baltica, Strain CSIRO CS-38" /LENGTH=50 /DNA_ID=CAMNT_0010657131 /DNA_START=137 /DNA_END=289 /DNA_ORIENTATION=-